MGKPQNSSLVTKLLSRNLDEIERAQFSLHCYIKRKPTIILSQKGQTNMRGQTITKNANDLSEDTVIQSKSLYNRI